MGQLTPMKARQVCDPTIEPDRIALRMSVMGAGWGEVLFQIVSAHASGSRSVNPRVRSQSSANTCGLAAVGPPWSGHSGSPGSRQSASGPPDTSQP